MTTETKEKSGTAIRALAPPDVHECLKKMAAEEDSGTISKVVRDITIDFCGIDTKHRNMLKKAAESRGMTVSALVQKLADSFLSENNDVKPIVLKVPLAVLSDRQQTKNWLTAKAQAILNHFFPVSK